MNFLEHFIYGIISGIARFLPISSTAHQAVYHTLCGVDHPDPLLSFLIDGALLAALITSYYSYYQLLQSSRSRASRRTRKQLQFTDSALDTRVVKNAVLPMLIISLVLYYIIGTNNSLMLVSVTLLANGILLFIPSRMLQGNKDGRFMSAMDSGLIGFVGALSAVPGFSGIGGAVSIAMMRGASSKKAIHWAALLSVPMLIVRLCVDFIRIFGFSTTAYINFNFFGYLLSILGAYCGACMGISIIKKLNTRSALSGFAFYSWGAALFAFILYLTVA